MSRFKDGLRTLGVLDAMQTHPAIFERLMCASETSSVETAESMKELFTAQLAEDGSNHRTVENLVMAWWWDLLDDIEARNFNGT